VPSGAVIELRSEEGAGRAKVQFTNPTKRPCRLSGYTLTWGGKHKTVTVKEVTIPAGETRDRWIKLDADEADAAQLPIENVGVKLAIDC